MDEKLICFPLWFPTLIDRILSNSFRSLFIHRPSDSTPKISKRINNIKEKMLFLMMNQAFFIGIFAWLPFPTVTSISSTAWLLFSAFFFKACPRRATRVLLKKIYNRSHISFGHLNCKHLRESIYDQITEKCQNPDDIMRITTNQISPRLANFL